MKIFKPGDEPQDDWSDLHDGLRQLIRDHYLGLPVMRGMSFEDDYENRFWGETSEGFYCSRILKSPPIYEVWESLRREFEKFSHLFPEGLDFFVFVPALDLRSRPISVGDETLCDFFSRLKSVRVISFQRVRTSDGEIALSFEEVLKTEKREDPIENPLPSFVVETGGVSDSRFDVSSPGPAALNKQEIEDFFEIALELKRMQVRGPLF